MSTTLASPPTASSSQNQLKAARNQMVERLLKVFVPTMPCACSPGDFESLQDHGRTVAQIFGEYWAALGHELRTNAVTSIDAHLFSSETITAAISDELYACQEQAEKLRDDADEWRAYRRA